MIGGAGGGIWDPNLGPQFGTPIWDPDLGVIWDPHLGSPFGTPIWDPHLGPPFGTPIWDPHLGPPFGTPIWDLYTQKCSQNKIVTDFGYLRACRFRKHQNLNRSSSLTFPNRNCGRNRRVVRKLLQIMCSQKTTLILCAVRKLLQIMCSHKNTAKCKLYVVIRPMIFTILLT
jgi:hypothetical protein